jgi:hypothetical protein
LKKPLGRVETKTLSQLEDWLGFLMATITRRRLDGPRDPHSKADDTGLEAEGKTQPLVAGRSLTRRVYGAAGEKSSGSAADKKADLQVADNEPPAAICFACNCERQFKSAEPASNGYEIRSYECQSCKTILRLAENGPRKASKM